MNGVPHISVVMAVYNGATSLPATLDSILTQEGVDLEFIVVNDGSTDNTAKILREYSCKDKRLKILEQENVGLTRSLIRGCTKASGEFIARQDAGDISLPGRLQHQRDFLISHDQVSMVSCGTRFVGPQGEVFQHLQQTADEAEQGLHCLTLDTVRGPSHHGSVMFRKNVYDQVGGYRQQFSVAQDLDLWLRLVEHGRHCSLPGIFYQASLTPDSISIVLRDRQLKTAHLILKAAAMRRAGQGEQQYLDQAESLGQEGADKSQQENDGACYYFLGCCLLRKNPAAARKYFVRTLKKNPLHVKALFRLLQSWFSP